MIDFSATEATIVGGLQSALTAAGFSCVVIMANQTSPIPEYPYASYTITSPIVANPGGYSVSSSGVRYKPVTQVWSLTVQSDNDGEANTAAMLMHDWLSCGSNTYLSDSGIAVQRVGNITNRDNLISIEYEYRRGFDVEFSLMSEISKADAETSGIIETATIENE